MSTTHKATLRHAVGLCAVFVLLAGLLLYAASTKGVGYFAVTAGLMIFVAWRFSRMHLILTDDTLIYRGWFRRFAFPYSSIERVSRPADEGWPKDRMYGVSVFEVASKESRARINLLWFGPSGSRAFRDRFITHEKKTGA